MSSSALFPLFLRQRVGRFDVMFPARAPLIVIRDNAEFLTPFGTGCNGHIYAAHSKDDDSDNDVFEWVHVASGVATSEAAVSVVNLGEERIDAFMIGTKNRVRTTHCNYRDRWVSWNPIGDITAASGSKVSATYFNERTKSLCNRSVRINLLE